MKSWPYILPATKDPVFDLCHCSIGFHWEFLLGVYRISRCVEYMDMGVATWGLRGEGSLY